MFLNPKVMKMKKIISAVINFFSAITGSFSWTAPPWVIFLKELRKARPAFFFFLVLLLVFLIMGSWGTIYFMKTRPKPDLIVMRAALNEITAPSEEITDPEPLLLSFSKDSARGTALPVARLDLVGKEMKSGVSIVPSIEGAWHWDNDKILKFQPKAPWPAQRKFTVTITPDILGKDIKLKDLRASFESSVFSAEFEKAPSLYTDPRKRSVHQASATVLFSHLTDEKSIRDGIHVSTSDAKGKDLPLNFSISMDKTGRRAHILSDPLKIEKDEQFLTLKVAKNARTVQGGAGLGAELVGKMKIPAVSTFFNIKEMRATIVPNLKNEPEQTITLAFSDSIRRTVLDGKVKAFLLPLKNPDSIDEHFTSQNDITKEILSKSTELPLKLSEVLGESSDRFGLVFDAPDNRDIYIIVEKGLKSDSGYELAKKFDTVMKVPTYPKEAKIVGQGGFMASTGEKTLAIQARGVRAVKIFVKRLLPRQIHHLVTQTGGDISNPYFHCGSFTEANISEGFEKVIPFAPKDNRTPVYTSLDLSEYIDPDGFKPGVFFVEVMGWDPETNTQVTHPYEEESLYRYEGETLPQDEGESEGYDYSYVRSYNPSSSDKRTVIVTDLAILIKNGVGKERDVFVESVSSGEPAAGAEVEIIARNGQTLQSGTTDGDGHVGFPYLGESSDRAREPVFCMVKKGSDISFLPFDRSQRQIDISRFDIGGVNTSLMDKDQINAFAFTDRGIYRPGETASMAFMVRSKGFSIPKGIPLEVHISGPLGILVKKRVQVPEGGFFEESLETDPASPTGQHRADLYLVSDKGYTDRLIGSTEFKVEEFEPDRMRMTSVLSEKNAGWSLPEKLGAAVSLKNLFGAPAQNRKIKAKIILEPAGFAFEKYEGFVFTDPLIDKDRPLKAVVKEIDEVLTDKDGNAVLDLGLGKFEKGTYRLTLSIQGFDEAGGKSVKAFNTSLVSPMTVITGFKADGDLSFIRQGSGRKVRFKAVDRQLAEKGLEKLSLRKVKVVSVSALIRQDNGTYAYQTAKKEETVWDKAFAIPAEGADLPLETEEAGEYVIEIRDESGLIMCRVPYTVAGESNIRADIDKTAELGIKLSQPSVKPGEEIEFQVTTPYKGAGLITIETDKVHAFAWFKADSLTSLHRIKVPENLEGNAYLSVALVRSMDDPEIFTSPLSYSVVPFGIDRSRRELIPELKVSEKVIPGEKMSISYKAQRPCRMVVFAVDEGILQFAAYKTPVPLDHFLKKLALEVSTIQTADLILPEYNLLIQRMGAGGDASAEALRARHLNPFARKNNRPAVYWSGILDAGPEEKTVEWETPDTFSGEVRVMAVAADSEGMGSSEKSTVVRGPFVISPVMPLAVTPGDIFTLTAGISNVHEGSGKGFPVVLRIDADKSLAVQGEAERTISLDEGSEAVEVFSVKATGAPGNATIRFTASSGDVKGKTSASLSIRPPVPDMTTIVSGRAESGKAQVKLSRRIIPEFAKQKIMASPSPLVLAAGMESWLDMFPYGCTEQLLSKGLPALAYASFPGESMTKENASEKVDAAVSMLRSRQNQDGGFAMWPGGQTDEFASLYAFHFLTDAAQAGFRVPGDMIESALGFAKAKAGELTGQDRFRLRAYAIYLLTRNGNVTSNYLMDLEKDLKQIKDKKVKDLKLKDITSSLMASSYRLMKEDSLSSGLYGKFDPKMARDDSDIFLGSMAGDAMDIYLTARHFPEKLKDIGDERLNSIIEPVLSGSYHTFEAAWAVLALGAWAGQGEAASVEISALSEKGEARKLDIVNDPFPSAMIGTDISSLDIKSGGRIFYSASQSGYDRDVPKTEIKDGLEIIRELRPAPEKLNQPVRTGDDMTVVLKIRALEGKYVDNAAITDMFAGCFSPDIPSVRENQGLSYMDVREDRAVFYGSFGPEVKEIIYKLRVTAPGEFTVPPAFGEALYNRRVKARSLPSVMIIVVE